MVPNPSVNWRPMMATLFALLISVCPDIHHRSIPHDFRLRIGVGELTQILEAFFDGLEALGIFGVAGHIRKVAIQVGLHFCLVTRCIGPLNAHLIPYADSSCRQLTFFAQLLFELPLRIVKDAFRHARDVVRNVFTLCPELHAMFDNRQAGIIPVKLADMVVTLEDHIAKGLGQKEWWVDGPKLFPGANDFDFIPFPIDDDAYAAALAAHAAETEARLGRVSPTDVYVSAEGGKEHALRRGPTLPHSFAPPLRCFRALISPVVATLDIYFKMLSRRESHPHQQWASMFALVEYFCRLHCCITGADFRQVFEDRPLDLPPPTRTTMKALKRHGRSHARNRRFPHGFATAGGVPMLWERQEAQAVRVRVKSRASIICTSQ